jgi:hypothetical protein
MLFCAALAPGTGRYTGVVGQESCSLSQASNTGADCDVQTDFTGSVACAREVRASFELSNDKKLVDGRM